MKLLTTEAVKDFDSLGWAERSVSQLHNQFAIALKRRCSAGSADLFATPELITSDKIEFYTESYAQASRYVDLSKDEREKLDAQIAMTVGEIETLRQNLLASDNDNEKNVATVLDSVLKIPGTSHIWRVDGKAVVTMWGYASGDDFVDLRSIQVPDKKVPPAPVIVTKRRKWPLAVALLALLALGAFFAWPPVSCSLGWRACHNPIANADDATLGLGAPHVDIDVVMNDVEPDGDPITILACDAPGQVIDARRVRYKRDPSLTTQSVAFNCTVADPEGNTDVGAVTVQIPVPANQPPRAKPDQVVLPLGKASIQHRIVDNDVDEDPSTLSVVSCNAPNVGTVTVAGKDITYSYQRDNRVNPFSVSFVCEIQDSAGLIDSATVTVEIPAAGNSAPTGGPISVVLPDGAPFVDVDVLAAMTDPDGDSMRLQSCSVPGVMYGNGARYERTTATVGTRTFSCVVEDTRGATSSVDVNVVVESEIGRCTPILSNQSLRLIVGLDVSRSMGGSDDKMGTAISAINRIMNDAPAAMDIILFGLQSDTTDMVSNIANGRASVKSYLTNIMTEVNGTDRDASPSFGVYSDWVVRELRRSVGNYEHVIVLTISDASDEFPDNGNVLRRALSSYQGSVEHINILLADNIASTRRANHRSVIWPSGGQNFKALANNNLTQLTSQILQAARIEKRTGCE